MCCFRVLAFGLAVGCQGGTASTKPAAALIEARSGQDVIAQAQPGAPCRVTIDSFQLQVGTNPLVMQNGTDRWTGEDAENGTTFRKNDQIVARIHAKQLFDENGVPILRVLDTGDIVDKSNAVLRKARVAGGKVMIDATSVTGTTDIAIAALLTAREALPEVRALAVCRLLQ